MPRQPAAVTAAMPHHNSAGMADCAPVFGSEIAPCETADGSLCPGGATAAVPLLRLMVFILTPGGLALTAALPGRMLHSTLSGGGLSSASSISWSRGIIGVTVKQTSGSSLQCMLLFRKRILS